MAVKEVPFFLVMHLKILAAGEGSRAHQAKGMWTARDGEHNRTWGGGQWTGEQSSRTVTSISMLQPSLISAGQKYHCLSSTQTQKPGASVPPMATLRLTEQL